MEITFTPWFWLFGGFTLIQLIYWTLFWRGLSRLQPLSGPQSPNPETTETGISVVIAARNEASRLKALLQALADQDYPEYEVIVVDDRSGDETYDLLREACTRYPFLKNLTIESVPDRFNPKKYALTMGIKAARYDRVLLTDADCLPGPEWISGVARVFTPAKKLVLGYSGYTAAAGLLNYFIRFETLFTGIQYLSLAAVGHPYMGVGRNLGVRKSFFLEKKGYHGFMEITGGDDDLFVNRYATAENTALAVGEPVWVSSLPKTSWSAYFRQKLRHLAVGKYYKGVDKWILGLFSFTNTLFWLTFVIVVSSGGNLVVAISGLLIRQSLLYLTFYTAGKKTGEKFALTGLPVADIMYWIYYTVTGIRAMLSKRIQWT